MVLLVCFTNYNLIIVCCQLCIKGREYRYFISASTFFQSGCDIIYVVNYVLKKKSVYYKFTVSASLDLLSIMSMIDLLLIMIDYCLFCSHLDLEIKLI